MPPARIRAGQLTLDGTNLLDLSEREMQKLRGKAVTMIFQEPMTSLNPKFKVGYQIAEVFRKHFGLRSSEAIERSVEMLALVGIPDPEERAKSYPFQLSGGMRQRVIIAMALAGDPQLLLADEPTTALDVTIQAQILDLIREINERSGTSMILITHDLGVIAELVQRVIVMYAGQIVEMTTTENLFDRPLHPYTVGLRNSIPDIDSPVSKYDGPLNEIAGSVPALDDLPIGCYFQGRCPKRMQVCADRQPVLKEVSPGHHVRCWLND